MQLKHLGNGYSGIDPQNGQVVACAAGETIKVSAQKAHQLLSDFPSEWQEDGTISFAATESDDQCEARAEEPDQSGTKPRRTKPAKVGHVK